MVNRRSSCSPRSRCRAHSRARGGTAKRLSRSSPSTTRADVALEVGGLARLPGGKLAVAIRRGEIWIAENPYADEGEGVRWKRFASGLHEPLGLAFRDGALFTTQRSEVTRLRDTDGDGVADEYLCAAKGWGVSGNYHEYAYGPKFDPAGNMWVTLNCSMGKGAVPEQRLARLQPAHRARWHSGSRSPAACVRRAASASTRRATSFIPSSRATGIAPAASITSARAPSTATPIRSPPANLPGAPFAKPAEHVQRVPVAEAARRMPIYKPAAVWLPYRKMGMSCTDITLDDTGGKFGPFAGQFFVGEFTMSQVNRVFLEKVGGEYQGACFPFLEGFQSAPLRMEFGDDGSLFVGETNRGWNSLGNRSYGLQRVIWSGRTPFEIQTMEARPNGFRCTFTKPVRRESARRARMAHQELHLRISRRLRRRRNRPAGTRRCKVADDLARWTDRRSRGSKICAQVSSTNSASPACSRRTPSCCATPSDITRSTESLSAEGERERYRRRRKPSSVAPPINPSSAVVGSGTRISWPRISPRAEPTSECSRKPCY